MVASLSLASAQAKFRRSKRQLRLAAHHFQALPRLYVLLAVKIGNFSAKSDGETSLREPRKRNALRSCGFQWPTRRPRGQYPTGTDSQTGDDDFLHRLNSIG